MTEPTATVLEELSRTGLLLQQDKRLPSVVGIVAGEPLSASWWSHPQARVIFRVLSELSDHRDVVFTKLLHRKVTLVHRSIWPALLAVASAGEPWQLQGLSASGRDLFTAVSAASTPIRRSGTAVKELEFSLLAHTEQVHTESGRHQTVLEPWSVWAQKVGVKPLRSAHAGRQQIEKAAQVLGAPASALPWASAFGAAT